MFEKNLTSKIVPWTILNWGIFIAACYYRELTLMFKRFFWPCVFFSNPILNYIHNVVGSMCLISDFWSSPTYKWKLLSFKIANDISFLNDIIFQNQWTLVLVGYSPARVPCSTYQTGLSQPSIYAFRSRTEFNHLNLDTSAKEHQLGNVFQPSLPYSIIPLVVINLTQFFFFFSDNYRHLEISRHLF